MVSHPLTICSVSYRHSRHILENIVLTQTLNPNTELKWLIVNNAPEDDSFDGVVNDGSICDIQIINGLPNNFEEPGKGSKHHAIGLDLAVSSAKTRFVLILDPDSYLVMPNWAERIIEYMIRNNITLFGIPWHPKWSIKWRYFPCPHCLLVDTKHINLSSFSFMPDFESSESLLERFFSKIPFIGRRVRVGSSRDTGYQIYKRCFGSTEIRHALAVPSFSRTDFYSKNTSKILVDWWFLCNKALDKVFPDSMSVFPKKKGYYTETCFSDLGLPDCKRFGWEEFFWNEEPFGFHVRGFSRKSVERHTEMQTICSVLKVFKDKIESAEV